MRFVIIFAALFAGCTDGNDRPPTQAAQACADACAPYLVWAVNFEGGGKCLCDMRFKQVNPVNK